MKDVEAHYKEFLEVVKKYNLDDQDKAEEISAYLTAHKHHDKGNVTPKQFARNFSMSEQEALTFLSFIERGLDFKQKHMAKEQS